MASLNKVILIGRLTADPELRYTTSDIAVAEFRIAVDRPFKSASGEKKTDFFRCKAWRQTAEFVNNYVKKGNLVAVEGRVEINEFTGQDGVKKYFTDIVCDQVQGLTSRSESGGSDTGGYAAAPPAAAPAPTRSNPPAAQPSSGGAEFDDFDDSDPFADE
jgi:single-strand DNA-binding protein